MTMVHALSPSTFFKAWVSALVVKGESVFQPDHPRTRRALNAVRTYFENRVKESVEDEDFEREYLLLELRNQFLPSNTGAFDGVERALRNLQTSLVMSPNPDYEEMVFEVPQSFAKAIVDSLVLTDRDLVQAAVEAYLESKKSSGLFAAS